LARRFCEFLRPVGVCQRIATSVARSDDGFESGESRGKSEIVIIEEMNLSKRQKSILVGTVLGDAYLQKTGKSNARLRLEHGVKQKDYLVWKANAFPRLFQGKPKEVSRKHPKSKKIYYYWRVQSDSSPELGRWRKYFYKNGKKKIPQDLKKYLDGLALAVWYMDDGYYYERDNVSYLYLGRVSEEEAKITSEALRENFVINSTIYDKKKKGFALYFPRGESEKLWKIVEPYMLDLFRYKLGKL